MKERFYTCKHCGNVIGLIHDAGVPVMCCGEKMQAVEPNTVDASKEKHLPVVSVNGNVVSVSVGSVAHPMLEEHFIEWVYLQTEKGGQRKILKAGDSTTVDFSLVDDTPIAVYAYCNLHGLWKTNI